MRNTSNIHLLLSEEALLGQLSSALPESRPQPKARQHLSEFTTPRRFSRISLTASVSDQQQQQQHKQHEPFFSDIVIIISPPSERASTLVPSRPLSYVSSSSPQSQSQPAAAEIKVKAEQPPAAPVDQPTLPVAAQERQDSNNSSQGEESVGGGGEVCRKETRSFSFLAYSLLATARKTQSLRAVTRTTSASIADAATRTSAFRQASSTSASEHNNNAAAAAAAVAADMSDAKSREQTRSSQSLSSHDTYKTCREEETTSEERTPHNPLLNNDNTLSRSTSSSSSDGSSSSEYDDGDELNSTLKNSTNDLERRIDGQPVLVFDEMLSDDECGHDYEDDDEEGVENIGAIEAHEIKRIREANCRKMSLVSGVYEVPTNVSLRSSSFVCCPITQTCSRRVHKKEQAETTLDPVIPAAPTTAAATTVVNNNRHSDHNRRNSMLLNKILAMETSRVSSHSFLDQQHQQQQQGMFHSQQAIGPYQQDANARFVLYCNLYSFLHTIVFYNSYRMM